MSTLRGKIKKQKLREMKWLPYSYTVGMWQSRE